MTDTAIRQEGMRILIKNLGTVEAERFVSLIIKEPFDYTEWRYQNLEDEEVRSLSRKAMNYKKLGMPEAELQARL